MRFRSTLEQWITLQEIHRSGSIQAAAEVLNKSHTALIYAIRKLEQQLDIKLVEVKGRRAKLSSAGMALLRRADNMLEQAQDLEELSQQIASGVESDITVAVDHLCDPHMVCRALSAFVKENTATSVQVFETSLSKTRDMVLSQLADVAVINLPITNFPAEALSVTSMVPVVAKGHELTEKANLAMADLTRYCQIVVRDAGGANHPGDSLDVGWLKGQQRMTVDNFEQAIYAVEAGVGFCRLPEHLLNENKSEKLTVLGVEGSNCYQVPVHILLPKGPKTGPAARKLYQLIISQAQRE